MAKVQHEFQAETKQLLDLMIHSIYTNHEIFLRELISNASDALDKLHFAALTDSALREGDESAEIFLVPDEASHTLSISDNGIGMTKDELELNLGTIARSGSQNFKTEDTAHGAKNASKIDIIGQFGVGFYSAFMVSDLVTVTSKAYGSEQAYTWTSSGADGYTITQSSWSGTGTEIVLHLKEDRDDEDYSTFLEEYTIRNLIKKYSDYIRYPIKMTVTKSRRKADADSEDKAPEYEQYRELETLNSMEPIWKRQKSKVKPEEYNSYYKSKFYDYADPARVIRTSVEGVSSRTPVHSRPRSL